MYVMPRLVGKRVRNGARVKEEAAKQNGTANWKLRFKPPTPLLPTPCSLGRARCSAAVSSLAAGEKCPRFPAPWLWRFFGPHLPPFALSRRRRFAITRLELLIAIARPGLNQRVGLTHIH
jgi:hypothetical protein